MPGHRRVHPADSCASNSVLLATPSALCCLPACLPVKRCQASSGHPAPLGYGLQAGGSVIHPQSQNVTHHVAPKMWTWPTDETQDWGSPGNETWHLATGNHPLAA